MKEELIIIGGGEHSNIIINALDSEKWNFLGLIDPKGNSDITCFDAGKSLEQISAEHINAKFIIGLGDCKVRKMIIKKYSDILFERYTTVIHSASIIASSSIIEFDVFIGAGAIIQPKSIVSEHCIINTASIIEHDCIIAENTHIAPGVVLGGGCKIGRNCLIGLGARVKDHITIGNNVTVGAGAIVVNDIGDNLTVFGVPARI